MIRNGGVILVGAALVFGASALAFGATVVGSVRVDATTGGGDSWTGDSQQETEPAAVVSGEEGAGGQEGLEGQGSFLAGEVYPRVTEAEVLGAVNQDVFQPDRTPPPERYVLPSQRPEVRETAGNDRRRGGPDLRVVGAALMGDGALALIQVEDSVPLAVLLGESVEGYTLAAVDAESATLVRDDETMTLPVVEQLRDDRSNQSRGRNARGNTNNARDVEALQQRLQQAIQSMQQRGQVMQRGGVQVVPGGTVTWQPGGNVQIIRGAGGGQSTGSVPIIVRPRGGGGGEEEFIP